MSVIHLGPVCINDLWYYISGVERYSGRQLESEQHEQKSPCNFQYDPTNKILSPVETHDERECKSE